MKAAETVCWFPASGGPAFGSPPELGPALTVYRAATADFLELDSALLASVTAEEQARAGRYRRPADRARFLVGRACLRALLGRQLQRPPTAVPLVLNAFGKPQLAHPAGIEFNVAHSGAWVLLATGPQAVGIDVEQVEPHFDYAAVAAHSFSAAEQAKIRQSADPRAAFYAHWTRLEARRKATGHGLSDEASLNRGAAWTVRSFEVAPGYPAALAHPVGWQPAMAFRTCDGGFIR